MKQPLVIDFSACQVSQIYPEQTYLKFFYALGSGPQMFPFPKYGQLPRCDMPIDRFELIPLKNTTVPFSVVGSSFQLDQAINRTLVNKVFKWRVVAESGGI